MPPTRSIREVALGLLARRDHGREELREKLLRREFGQAEVAQVLDDLTAKGWLNDQRTAKDMASYLTRSRPQGPNRVRDTLRQKRRLGAEVVDGAMAALAEEGVDWMARAQQALRTKRLKPDDPKQRARLIRFLLGRGFDMGTAIRAVDAYLRGDPEDP